MPTNKTWPADWPRHLQDYLDSPRQCCTMLVGPCRYGETHVDGEFTLRADRALLRWGQPVPAFHGRPPAGA